jgi:hypothetical protein
MPRGSADQPKTPGQINVYWRRRVIALAAGLGMLALVTWTVNGALGGGSRQATDLSQTTSQHSGAPSTPPATGSASASPGGTASATPSPTGDPAPTPSPSATGHATAKRHGARHGRKTAASASAACPRADLVLSLTSARSSYPAHAQPQFDVDVVSTAPGRCTTNLGPINLHVVIRAGGKQIWDSADCAGPAPRAATLARGVPAVVQITWNRKTSAPGCRAAHRVVHRAVRPGTYTASGYSGNVGSRAMTFVLKGP